MPWSALLVLLLALLSGVSVSLCQVFTTDIGFSIITLQQTVPVTGGALTLTFQQQSPLTVANPNNAICTNGLQPISSSGATLVVNWGEFDCAASDYTHTLLSTGSIQFTGGAPQFVASTQGASSKVGVCRTAVALQIQNDGTYTLIVNGSALVSNKTGGPNQWTATGTYSLFAASNPCSTSGSSTSSSSSATGSSSGGGSGVQLVVVTVNGDSSTLNKTRLIDAFAQATGLNPNLISISSITVLGRRRSTQYQVVVSVSSTSSADQTAVNSLTKTTAQTYKTFVSQSGLIVQSITVQTSSSDAPERLVPFYLRWLALL